ncbi:flavin-containing monooxygenase [Nucisporomicrobium flavum]|uniref:flavin-containing monooxygenase n=1 Tax=Nucisporomicrobium flavum TaxID=2785915 RepID=UPI0018F28A9F|nr:NAD(P)/FAD-dependent oxidoreductase [Nucisporomicrobium flavum]
MSRRDQYLIVGAGPAGLAAARLMKERGHRFVQVDRNLGVGGIWNTNSKTPLYDSVRLITSREMSSFLGSPMPADFPDFPDRRQALGYLETYSEATGSLPDVRFGLGVSRVSPADRQQWRVTFDDGTVEIFDGVLMASGFNQTPYMPRRYTAFKGTVIHSSEYWTPYEFAGQRVLVVGCGNSAIDIAAECLSASATVDISIRRPRWWIPLYLDGIPSDLPDLASLDLNDPLCALKDQLRLRERLIGENEQFVTRGWRVPITLPMELPFVESPNLPTLLGDERGCIQGNVTAVEGSRVHFATGPSKEYDTLIVCSGYRDDIPYLDGSLKSWDSYILNIFNRRFAGLYALNNLHSNLGGFWTAEISAQLVVMLLDANATQERSGWDRVQEWASRPFDLRAGGQFGECPQHSPTVYGLRYIAAARDLALQLGGTLQVHPLWCWEGLQ